MADVDSTIISNRAASPRVANDPWTNAKLKTTGPGILEVTTAELAGAELRFCKIASNAVVQRVLLSSDAHTTTGAIDIGVYRTDDDGSAVVDADFFASAASIITAVSNSDVTHESGIYGIEDKNKPLWEALGLASDPGVIYDVAGTVTTAAGSTGTVCVEVVYVDGGA